MVDIDIYIYIYIKTLISGASQPLQRLGPSYFGSALNSREDQPSLAWYSEYLCNSRNFVLQKRPIFVESTDVMIMARTS